MNIIDIINKKRTNNNLTYEEIEYAINSYVDGTIKDYQMSSLLMAICINGMNDDEINNMTKIMKDSGNNIDLSKIDGKKVDKHSTGGVGDKTTLIVAPIVSACDVVVAKMSGRGLGYTGGTIDKLESIKNFNVSLTEQEFIDQLKNIKVAITSQNNDLVPADKKIYELRDVTGTVSSVPLIASSIMSKKLASTTDAIILDVKIGRGSLLPKQQTKQLAEIMVKIGKNFNKKTIAIISNMDYPLGKTIGNALEVKEAIEVLQGNGDKRLTELSLIISGYMIMSAKNITYKEAYKMAQETLENKKAYNKFIELIKYQNGDINDIKLHDNIIEVKSNKTGYINDINALELAKYSKLLGSGRTTKEDKIDYGVGIELTKQLGEYVKEGEVLLKIYGDIYNEEILSSFVIEEEKKDIAPLILDIIS